LLILVRDWKTDRRRADAVVRREEIANEREQIVNDALRAQLAGIPSSPDGGSTDGQTLVVTPSPKELPTSVTETRNGRPRPLHPRRRRRPQPQSQSGDCFGTRIIAH